ncbi:MAG: DUF1932 domain-containing protein [Pseudomonadota bacterium]
MPSERVALIGFGEVGQTLTADLAGQTLAAFDCLFDRPGSWPHRRIAATGVRQATNHHDAVAGCYVIISAVTADQALAAARSAAGGLHPGSWYLDVNSISPAARREIAAVVESAGATYVEAAVMAPIQPAGIRSPMLLGGPGAEQFLPVGQHLGFTGARFLTAELGKASATKLCRSIVVKGLEALVSESLTAARFHGVDRHVLESLGNLLPAADWPEFARYLIGRSRRHGVRRAAELRHAAATVAETGLEPVMSEAAARRQQASAARRPDPPDAGLADLLDALRPQPGSGKAPAS